MLPHLKARHELSRFYSRGLWRGSCADNTAAGSILNSTGSVGLALMYWVIGFIMALAGFSVYLEFASYFPNRSGAQVVYLEQAYPRPKHLFPVAFAVQEVILSFSSSNAIGGFCFENACHFEDAD